MTPKISTRIASAPYSDNPSSERPISTPPVSEPPGPPAPSIEPRAPPEAPPDEEPPIDDDPIIEDEPIDEPPIPIISEDAGVSTGIANGTLLSGQTRMCFTSIGIALLAQLTKSSGTRRWSTTTFKQTGIILNSAKDGLSLARSGFPSKSR